MKTKFNYILAILFFSSLNIVAQTANWSALKPDLFPTNVSGQIHGLSRVSQLKFHPTNSNKMYAISARGGLFISTNAGTNWVVAPGTDFMPYARLASVCIDYTDDQILYLGTGDHNYYYSGSGVWKSTDGGNTFTPSGLSGRLVVDMVMDPTDHNKIVAVTDAGIYKTINAGTSWTLMTASRPFDDLKQRTPVSRTLFAASADSAFFRSTDFGDTWTQITSGIVLPSGVTNGNGCRVAITPADTNIVYLGMVANGGLLYKSTDGGLTFTGIKTTSPPYLTYYTNSASDGGQGDYNFGIGVDRLNANIVYVVAHVVWKSTNGGVSWTQLTNWWATVHTDMHQIVNNPYNNNQLYNMNDGGVWLSTDGGVNWTPKSDGLNGYEIYHGNCSPTRRDMMSIGTQDNGELYSTTAGWFTNRGGDWGSQCAFDYRANSAMVYYYGSNKRRLVTGGETTYGLPAQATILHDIAFHRSNPNLAFVADSFIYRTTTLTSALPTWTQILSTGRRVMAMHSHFGDANRLYIVTDDSKIYVSTNALSATPTFTQYTIPGSSNNKASITSIKSSLNTIYISANAKVFRSSDNGATWTDVTYNLPSVNHVRVIADEYYSSNEMVLIASANTVYYKVGSAVAWSIFNTNLPSRTDAIDLSIFNDSTTNSVLRYACYGRSVWETNLNDIRTLHADFAADNTNPCIGATVQFSDASTGNITSRTWSFPGGTPSTSTAINPTVVYSTGGLYSVSLTVSDGVTSNSKTSTNYISTLGASLPVIEGFEGVATPPTGWKSIDNGTSGYAWAKTTLAGGSGNSPSSMLFDNYSWNVPGQKDELQVIRLSTVGISSAKLKFDVAYQVFSGYSDSLVVRVSTDCGNSFTNIYQKGGTILSTAGSGGNNFVPTSAQWRTDSVDLAAYLGLPSVILQFQNINGYGNKLYIDNVNLSASCTNPTLPTIAATSSTICAGQSTTLSISSGSLNSATNWKWYSGSCGGTVVGTGSSITVSPASTTTYYARGEGGCVVNGACVNSTITVNALPIVTASNVSGCVGNSVALIGNPVGGTFSVSNPYTGPSTTYTYTYMNGLGCSATSSPATITMYSASVNSPQTISACNSYTWPVNGITYTNSGTKTASFLNSHGCDSIRILNLTINSSSSSSATISSPNSYTWSANGITYTNSGVYNHTLINAAGCDSVLTLNLTITGIKISPKVLLAGPYISATGLMFDSLRVHNLIPTTEPYSTPPLNFPQIGYAGGETVSPSILSVTGANAIVDWVFLELRSSSNPSTIIATKRALVQRDGDVVSSTDGTSPISFPNQLNGSYYVSIKHRNHLGVMTANPITLTNATTTINFSSTAPVWTSPTISNPPRKADGSVMLLFCGDANFNKNIKYNGASNDKDKVLNAVGIATPNNIVTGYRMEDLNLDTKVKYNNSDNDRGVILNSVGGNTPNVILFQHTPN